VHGKAKSNFDARIESGDDCFSGRLGLLGLLDAPESGYGCSAGANPILGCS
jgi:hypothetical protein